MADALIAMAAVMFTDLVGSTELRLRIGEDRADVVRAQHDAVLVAAVGEHRGRIVKHLGDGVMATFASCTDALAAAVAIQRAVDLANRQSRGERLAIRIGISAGDVSFEGDDCFGLAVIEAQRLESGAEPGSIWCADAVTQLSRGRGGHEFRPLGPVHLKGLAEPVAASEVLWEPVRETSVHDAPLPSALKGGGLPFAGRDDVFERLVERWSACARGAFGLVLLAGEPGVGKTRLAQELARHVVADTTRTDGPERTAAVLAGRCDEGARIPFQAFGAALEWFVRSEPAERLPTSLGEFPGDLVRLVPRLGDAVANLPSPLRDEPDAERFRLFEAVTSWLTAAASLHPRLLVIDDLHAADISTMQLLRRLSHLQPPGVLIVGTYRDTDVDATHPLTSVLADLRKLDGVTRIAVDGLGPAGVRELLERASGHWLDDTGLEFAERMQRETSGNPFFVGEVLRDLIENGTLVERDGRWTSDLLVDDAGIPDGVRTVVGQRLHRLGGEVERMLRAASVIGHEFDVDLLADVLGEEIDDVLDRLETAAAANLVVEIGVDRFRFAHAIVRETLHDEFSASRRSREHRKVAVALEARSSDDLDAVVPELASHWAEASGDDARTRALDLAVRAGEVAASRGAYEDAAGWYERALELIDDPAGSEPQYRLLLVQLAEAQAVSGLAVEARRHALAAARSAIDVDDAATAVAALRVRSRHSFSASDPADPERVELLRRALSMSLSTWQRAALLGELAKELIFERDLVGRSRALEEQQALIDRLPVRERVQLAATAGVTSYRLPGRAALQRQLDEANQVLAAEDLSASDRWRLHGHAAYTALHLGNRVALDDAIVGMEQVGNATGAVRVTMTLLHRTMRALLDGDLVAADRLAADLVSQLDELGVPDAASYRSTTLLASSRERRTMDELRPALDELEVSAHPAGPERATAALVRFLHGDLDRVRVALHDLDGEEFADDATLQLCLAYWAEIVAGLRSAPHCRVFIERLRDSSGANLLIGGLYLGPVDRLLALLHEAVGDHGRADALFAAAVAQQHALSSPPWTARTQLDWASALLARGEVERAADCITAADEAIGDLDLPDCRHRHGELVAHVAARG